MHPNINWPNNKHHHLLLQPNLNFITTITINDITPITIPIAIISFSGNSCNRHDNHQILISLLTMIIIYRKSNEWSIFDIDLICAEKSIVNNWFEKYVELVSPGKKSFFVVVNDFIMDICIMLMFPKYLIMRTKKLLNFNKIQQIHSIINFLHTYICIHKKKNNKSVIQLSINKIKYCCEILFFISLSDLFLYSYCKICFLASINHLA